MSVSIQPESVVASTFHAYVLLVEDEPAISGFVRRGLIFEGFEVDVAINGHIALEKIRDRQPDLLA
jgi:two-component system response regulator TrcR